MLGTMSLKFMKLHILQFPYSTHYSPSYDQIFSQVLFFSNTRKFYPFLLKDANLYTRTYQRVKRSFCIVFFISSVRKLVEN